MNSSASTKGPTTGDALGQNCGHTFFYGLPTVVALVLGGSWLMHRALRPVEALTARAEQVHAGNLSERIPRTGTGDELDRLAEVFNAMLARIEAGTASVRDFALHASHELKTPLTILSAEAELALNDPTIAGAERLRLTSQMEELRRLGRLVDALTLDAKADVGAPVIARERLDLGQLVRQAAEDARILGNPSEIGVEIIHCDDAQLDGDSAALRQVLLNLLDNAVKHNTRGGWVRIELRTSPDDVTLSIDNSGTPIPAELVPRLFQRFVRGSGTAAGSGLGLEHRQIDGRSSWRRHSLFSPGGRYRAFYGSIPHEPRDTQGIAAAVLHFAPNCTALLHLEGHDTRFDTRTARFWAFLL